MKILKRNIPLFLTLFLLLGLFIFTTTSTKAVEYFQLTKTSVNLRSGPSTSSKIVTVVPKCATLEYKSTSKGWYLVRYKGKMGYVHPSNLITKPYGKGLSVVGSSNSTMVETPYVTTANLNLRQTASLSGKSLLVIPKATTVTVVDITSDGWCRVFYKNTAGYISIEYLKDK